MAWVPPDAPDYQTTENAGAPRVVFIGTVHGGNAEALNHFLDDVWPLVRAKAPALVLLDIFLPDMLGWTVLARLKLEKGDTVFVTDAPGGIALTPYLGTQYVRVANDGFDEGGSTGFGLRANAWDSSRWQGFAGLRAARGWRIGDVDLRADARAEWQQTLAANGSLFDASFTGLEQWAPLQGVGLAQRSQLFGVGVSAAFGGKAMFRFDLSRRSSDVGDSNMASLQAMLRF